MHRGFLLLVILFAAFCWLLEACSDGKTHPVVRVERDTTIVPANSYSDIFLDSLKLSKYLSQHQPPDSIGRLMLNFYNSRNYQAAWFTEQGKLSEQAIAFWNLHEQYFQLSQDSTLYDKQLHGIVNRLVEEDTSLVPTGNLLVDTELGLTEHFLEFARYAYAGRLNPSELHWYIPRKKVNAIALLDSLLAQKGRNLDNWEPVNPMYARIRNKLRDYYELQRNHSLDVLDLGAKKLLKAGDTGSTVVGLRQRLVLLGDMPDTRDSSRRFDEALVKGVKQAQKRFGYTANGVVNPELLKQLNKPLELRIQQMLINMERMRWVPSEAKGDRIIVNIPEFRLHVFNDLGKVMDMRIVVGKAANRTVVFNDKLQYVVFSPYWNVPPSIVRNEILPAMRRNPGYLSRHNMEQTGTSGGLPVIRQKPGGANSLGLVKFLFPNSYNIYFHDTPSKGLFEQDKRAFSHGCIRLAEPVKLARWLLRFQPEWTPEKIAEAMQLKKEKWVTLTKPVPVFISYFTAWVDRDGLLHFRDDIYGHDAEMASRMFGGLALN